MDTCKNYTLATTLDRRTCTIGYTYTHELRSPRCRVLCICTYRVYLLCFHFSSSSPTHTLTHSPSRPHTHTGIKVVSRSFAVGLASWCLLEAGSTLRLHGTARSPQKNVMGNALPARALPACSLRLHSWIIIMVLLYQQTSYDSLQNNLHHTHRGCNLCATHT